MDLDFSQLNDEQVTSLLHAVIDESISRGLRMTLTELERASVVFAASELEAARIREGEARRLAREASERLRRDEEEKRIDEARDKERRLWALKKGVALAVIPLLGAGMTVNAWIDGSSKERRLFIGRGFGKNRVVFHITGNRRNPPGSIDLDDDLCPRRAEIVRLCAAIAAVWTQTKIDCDQAAAWSGYGVPLAGYTPAEVSS